MLKNNSKFKKLIKEIKIFKKSKNFSKNSKFSNTQNLKKILKRNLSFSKTFKLLKPGIVVFRVLQSDAFVSSTNDHNGNRQNVLAY